MSTERKSAPTPTTLMVDISARFNRQAADVLSIIEIIKKLLPN